MVTCCPLTSREGTRPEMPLAEAAAILRHSPTVLPYEPLADCAALGRLAEYCERFSPTVGWKTLTPRALDSQADWFGESPGHLFCDVSGIGGLFGGELALAHAIISRLRNHGLIAQVAITEALGASWALAISAQPVVVPTGELPAALAALPLTRLRLRSEALEILERLGLQTIDQLARMPRDGLADRFGMSLLLRLDQAFGQATEIIVPYRPAPKYQAACDLEYPTARRDLLDRLIVRLIEPIADDLRDRCTGVLRLVGCFQCANESVTFEVGFYRPAQVAKQLLDLLRLQLDRIVLPAPVRRIELSATRTAPIVDQAGELFIGEAGNTAPEFAALVERLGSHIGLQALVRPVLVADAVPERAYQYVPIMNARHRSGSSTVPATISHRPLRLFAPPVRIEVECSPRGSPKSFRQRDWQTIQRSWGPERIETGWWRRGLIRRDYYRVETKLGHRFWLFCDLHDHAWYLHGSFE